jgi:glycosyltransferase involved in cell wall biosynthesis
LVVIFHGFDAFMEVTLIRYRDTYRELFASAAALVAVSEPMRRQLIGLGAPAERIVVNPCGVDPGVFQLASPASAEPLFLAVGRFVGKKGPLHTIRAFAKVHQVLPSTRLTMIGTGPLLESSQTLAAELGVSDAISFLGACSHATVQAQVHQARAVVQHSMCCESGDQEGTPVALIEAQMAGVPVVATTHAGIPGVVLDGRTGFLVPEGDVDGMAMAMLRLAQDPQLAAEMGIAARAHALQHHTMDRHINALAATIHDAINRHHAAAST